MSIYYIFEDDERDDIQRLFLKVYEGYNSTKCYMHWARGSTKIISVISNIYRKHSIDIEQITNETLSRAKALRAKGIQADNKNISDTISRLQSIEIYVFLDLVPDNAHTVTIYNKLRTLKMIGCNILVFPIPCSEYYMLKTICTLGVQSKTSDIEIALSRGVYCKSELVKMQGTSYITNFEKYCKVLLLNADKLCVHKSTEEDRNLRVGLKGRFYSRDCSTCQHCDIQESLQKKSESLLSNYPCFPAGGAFDYFRVIRKTREECIDIHRKLVDEYNEAVKKYRDFYRPFMTSVEKLNSKFKLIQYFE